MTFGIQIASFLFLSSILINYFSHKRLPLQSTKYFNIFLFLCVFNLLAEIGTLITINNDELINTYLNRFTHQLFIGSINALVVSLFLYVDLKCRRQRQYKIPELLLRLTPFLISLIFIIFGDLKYNTTSHSRYSYGVMAYTIYICVFLYLTLLIVDIIHHKNNFSRSEIIAISLGIFSWAAITFVQFLKPDLLISSIAIVLMVQFVFISFENSVKYLVETDGVVFSKNALELTINEYLIKNKTFYVVNYLITNYEALAVEIGFDNIFSLVNSYAKDLAKKIKGSVFLEKDNSICVLLDDINEYNLLSNERSQIEVVSLHGLEYKIKLLKKGIPSSTITKFEDVIASVENTDDDITVFQDNKSSVIKIKDIYYVEVIENKTFIYTKKNCYESKDKLYQLEDLLSHWSFERCSKSMLVNIQKIKSVAKEANSRLIAYLINDESIIVSRQYVKQIKSKLKL